MAQEPHTPAWRRAIRVGLLSFALAALVNYLSDLTLAVVPALVALLVVLVLVAFHVAFDIVGTSVTAAEEAPLNAMAAKKVPGARHALWLVRNADRVANITNDVVGDVTGAVSGAAGSTVAIQFNNALHGGPHGGQLFSLGIIGFIAALTVGSKAAGKSFAMNEATSVVMIAGRILYTIERITGRSLIGTRGSNSSRRRTT